MSRSYDGAAAGWATGASLVYTPIAEVLVRRAPVPLQGASVLDVGAGTGVSEALLRAAGVDRIVGADLSYDMLRWNRDARPPALVCDVRRLPFVDGSFDAAVASFVLNHLTDPETALAEIGCAVRRGGGLLATVYANSSQSATRDVVDSIAVAHGWTAPEWYRELKESAAPLLGTADSMHAAAAAAGFVEVEVSEDAVDVQVTEPADLVDYRFGQAQFAAWLAGLDGDGRSACRDAAVRAIAGTMTPYRPRVVFLTCRVAR